MPSFVPVEKLIGTNEKSDLGYMCNSLVVDRVEKKKRQVGPMNGGCK
jgi:hypothetical protein